MKYLILSFITIFISCQTPKDKDAYHMPTDPHSFSVPSEAKVTHLHWVANVDFSRKVIGATATWDVQFADGAQEIVFDTKGLTIKSVSLDNGAQAEFSLEEADSLLGQALRISVDNDTRSISIKYETQPAAEAVQWLDPDWDVLGERETATT